MFFYANFSNKQWALIPGKGGGGSHKKGEDARREILNWPLKGTNLGVALTEFYP